MNFHQPKSIALYYSAIKYKVSYKRLDNVQMLAYANGDAFVLVVLY